MTKREELDQNGYVIFPSVIPEDLRLRCIEDICRTCAEINHQTFTWSAGLNQEYRQWAQPFLQEQAMALYGFESDIHIFNRQPGGDQEWHNDDQSFASGLPLGSISFRRAFACMYFVPTFDGRGPLRVIENSHRGIYEDFRTAAHTMRLKTSRIPPYQDYDGQPRKDFPEMFADHPNQIKLEVPAGSMIVVDERTIHGVCMNTSPDLRPMALWWLFAGSM